MSMVIHHHDIAFFDGFDG